MAPTLREQFDILDESQIVAQRLRQALWSAMCQLEGEMKHCEEILGGVSQVVSLRKAVEALHLVGPSVQATADQVENQLILVIGDGVGKHNLGILYQDYRIALNRISVVYDRTQVVLSNIKEELNRLNLAIVKAPSER